MYVARCKRIFIFIGVVYECVWGGVGGGGGGGGGGEANITIRMTKTEGHPIAIPLWLSNRPILTRQSIM